MVDATTLQVQTVTAMKIANPPTAVLKKHFGVNATHKIILDADFTLRGAANSESSVEGKASPT
jgi:hypothetical protein